MTELIPVVDTNDEIIWYKNRKDITVDDVYRVSSLWIENSEWKILLAQRGFQKSNDPGKWWAAVAGTVEKWESYEENIYKEAEEELGITGFDLIKDEKIYTITKHKTFFCQYYILKTDKKADEFTLEYPEVESVRWFSKKELENICEASPDILVEMEYLWKRLKK